MAFLRFSWVTGFVIGLVFPGFVTTWKRLVEKYGFKRGLEFWRRLLLEIRVNTRQSKLTRFMHLE
jgi:hypothetical protein